MTVLCYHAVESDWRSGLAVTPQAFARQVEWLASHRQVLDVGDALRRTDARGRLPQGTAALTFDDGFASLHANAFPVLRRLGLPATVFLVAETLTDEGRPVDWVDDPPAWPLRTLTRAQVLEMRAAGIRFGSHSFSHLDLTQLTEAECVRDLRDSREVLEELLHEPVPLLAYPRGRHDPKVRAAARKAGFAFGLALPERAEPPGAFSIPRVGVYRRNQLTALRVKTARPYLSLRTSRVFPAMRSFVSPLRCALPRK